MNRTYKATGINLKGMPLGEADRLVTILTPEFGLVRAVVPGARKIKSKLRSKSELFSINELLIAKGRSLDKITQAETIESYPGLSRDLGKLAAAQYLAEIVLAIALSGQPQPELYFLLKEHLRRIEQLPANANAHPTPASELFPHLAQAVFHLLAIGGVCPQVHACCLTRQPLLAEVNDPDWRVGFSFDAGGIVSLAETQASNLETLKNFPPSKLEINTRLDGLELNLLQQLGEESLPNSQKNSSSAWVRVERLLRDYAQYHFGHSIRSASLVDTLYPAGL